MGPGDRRSQQPEQLDHQQQAERIGPGGVAVQRAPGQHRQHQQRQQRHQQQVGAVGAQVLQLALEGGAKARPPRRVHPCGHANSTLMPGRKPSTRATGRSRISKLRTS